MIPRASSNPPTPNQNAPLPETVPDAVSRPPAKAGLPTQARALTDWIDEEEEKLALEEDQTLPSREHPLTAEAAPAFTGEAIQVAEATPVAAGDAAPATTGATAGAAAGAGVPPALLAIGGIGLMAAAASGGGGDAPATPQATFDGKAIDGYLAGATVFVDVDGDGQLDADEPRATTDADGDFTLPQVAGQIIAFGGTDIATGLDFSGVLKAPSGATVVTPLTTLMAERMADGEDAETAQAAVLNALGLGGLNADVDLTRLDPVAAAGAGDADALALHKAGVAVAALVAQVTEQLRDAAGGGEREDIAAEAFALLAGHLVANGLQGGNLGNAAGGLLDALAAQDSVGGVALDAAARNALENTRAFVVETLNGLAGKLGDSQDLDGIGNAQKDAQDSTFRLQLLHFSDAEAGLLASRTAPNLAALVDAFEDDYANSITLAGGDNFIPGPFLAAGTDSSLISVLNAVTGSTLAASATVPIGAVDIAIHNAIGVEASAIGNHEYDLGSRVLKDAIAGSSGSKGAQFPFISANLDYSGDGDLNSLYTNTTALTGLESASSYKGKLVPSAVLTENGARIGLVGATTQILEAISSPSGTEVLGFPVGPGANGEVDDMDLLAAQLQPVIDDLISQGVNKIILMAHLQVIGNEKLLASKLSGVDIILSAGSNTRLGDADDTAVAFPGHAASFADTYPLLIQDKDGNDTLVVNTDNEFTYLGRLVVDFDAQGHIVTQSLADNVGINGAYAATDANVAAAWGVAEADLGTTAFADGTRGDAVKTLTDAVEDVITVKDGNVFGYSDVYLEGERLAVRNQETNLGDLSADANAHAAALALGDAAASAYIVSLKNGGGIRAQIGTISAPDPVDGTVDKLPPPDGSVSQLDVENSLRFNNQLMLFDTTPEGLKAILEHGVAVLGNQGRFPQIGGVAFSYDPDLAAGGRIGDLALMGEDGAVVNLYNDGVKLASAPASISVVTLNFLANGGDSYPMKANGENFRYLMQQADGGFALSAAVDEALNYTDAGVIATHVTGGNVLLGEQAAFETYMKDFHATPETAYDQADTPEALDERIQNRNVRIEDVLSDNTAPVLVATSPADDVVGVTSHHIILTFDEAVMAGSGDIVISGGNGSQTDTRTIAVGDVTQVTISGNTVDINPGADLLNGYSYNVQLASGVIKDVAGNAFAGITTPTELNFTRAVPGVSTLLITELNSNADGGDFFELYNYGSTAIDLTGWKWDDNSASFTDAGVASFASGTTIAAGGRLLVAASATDTAALKTAWGLGADVPVVAVGGPGLGSGDAVVLFNAAGQVVTAFNYGAALTASDGSAIAVSAATPGVTFAVGHAGTAFGGSQQTSAVWDGVSTSAPAYLAAQVGVNGGFAQPAIATTIGSPGVVTGASVPDTTAPLLSSAQPADGATDVGIANNLVLTFNEAVKAGSGNFVLTNLAAAGDTRGIAVGDATQVNFSGTTVTLNPGADLLFGASYALTFAAGVVQDLAGNAHAGVTAATELNFSTGAAPLPSVLISEVNSNAGPADFFEIYNHGATPIDLSGWKWDDDSASFTDAAAASFASGTTLAAGGRLVVVAGSDAAAFKTAWGLGDDVQVIATGGPGLGQNDAVVLFNQTGTVVASLNYGTAKTASDGTPVAPSIAAPGVTPATGHAGAVFGGTATTSAVWDGESTSAPAYQAAVAGVAGGFAQPATAANIGSPGQVFGAIAAPTLSFTAPDTSYDLANYTLAGRHALPVNPSAANKLAHEASGVTYNRDTDTLFVVGDGGTSVAQVSKQGVLIDSMPLAAGGSPQGTYFYDPEGIAYIGGGKFVFVEERDREFNEFTYVAGTTLGADSGVRTVKLGTTIGNVGIEGLTYDPLSGGFIAVKETTPLGLFQATVDFAAGTASNGSPTTENSVNLFDPALTGLSTHNDVFALSNILAGDAAGYSHLLVLSAPDGKVVMLDREGHVLGSLAISPAAKNEGITMDAAGNLYIVGEEGGGNIDSPELLVYSPTTSSQAVGLGSHLYLSFNQPVLAGAGDIVLSNGAGDVRSIAVGDASQVSFDGGTVRINPASDLIIGSTYAITYAAGVFKDGHGGDVPAATGSALGFATASDTQTLAAGDLVFLAVNADATDAFAFQFLKAVAAGTRIVFSDRNYSEATGMPTSGEAAYVWTADQAYDAGTIVTIQPDNTNPIADHGSVLGAGGGISTSAETLYAFTGAVAGLGAGTAGALTVNTFLAAINVGGAAAGDIPASLANTPGAYVGFSQEDVFYSGLAWSGAADTAAYLARLEDAGNWNRGDSPAHQFSNGSLYDDAAAITRISSLQGEGAASPLLDAWHWVEAVVTAVMPGLGGFYLQEEAVDSDGNVATSEGIFVYHGGNVPGITDANIGDTVRLHGQVAEYNGLTELKNISNLRVVHDGNSLDVPDAVSLTIPVLDYALWEQYEGMRVEIRAESGDLTVTDNYNLGRYGQVALSSGGILEQFTENNAPGVAAYSAYSAATRANQIILDDGNSAQNPDPEIFARDGANLSAGNTLRAGDSTPVIRGVLDQFATGAELAYETTYRVQATEDPLFSGAARPTAADLQTALGAAEIKVASVNVLNFFSTFGAADFTTPYGTAQAGRGADDATEFQRQLDKLLDNLFGLDADVYGLMEIQNNGFADGSALDALVDAMNARAGAAKYAYIAGPFDDGDGVDEPTAGDDAIMVALVYDATAVAPLGQAAVPDADLYDAFGATYGNRVPVAQTFQSLTDGETFTVVANHLKSKGSVLDADLGDGQGANNLARMQGVTDLVAWLATNPTGAPDGDTLLLGDFNAYSMEDPIAYLQSHGYSLLDGGLSYSFDGLWGALDHALASASLASQVTNAVEWAINAEEPSVLDYNSNYKSAGQIAGFYAADEYRSSDHNPLLIGLNLTGGAADTRAPELLTATANGDTIRLGYDENLKPGNLPAAERFAVSVNGGDGPAVVSLAVRGGELSLTLASPLAFGDSIALGYSDPAGDDADAIQDIAGNDAAALVAQALDNATPSLDVTAPSLVSSLPADGASGVASGANLLLTFSEPMRKGSGQIVIRHLADGTLFENIDVASDQISVSGAEVEVNPAANLALGVDYYVEMAAGVLTDAFGNAFAGLQGDAALNFSSQPGTPVFISELHYDNAGTDANEGIGIFGPAGTDLTGWSVVFYNGGVTSNQPYATLNLSGSIDNENNSGYGELSFSQPGIQNGAPDALALVNAAGGLVQFLSYEGGFVGAGGVANGVASQDIGVLEAGTEAAGLALQLSGTGHFYESLLWNGPASATPGSLNPGVIV